MVVNPGDPRPSVCTLLGKFAFRLVRGTTGLVFGDTTNHIMKGRLPRAADKALYDIALNGNGLDLCDTGEIVQGKVLKSQIKIVPPTITKRTWGIVGGGSASATPPNELVPFFRIVDVCRPLNHQQDTFGGDDWCRLSYFPAPSWRVVRKRIVDNSGGIEVIMSGSISAGRFIGLPASIVSEEPLLDVISPEHYQMEIEYWLQAGGGDVGFDPAFDESVFVRNIKSAQGCSIGENQGNPCL